MRVSGFSLDLEMSPGVRRHRGILRGHDSSSGCDSSTSASWAISGPAVAPGDLLVLRAGTGADASDRSTVTTGAVPDTPAALALGSQFFLQLAKPTSSGGYTPIQATFALSNASPSIPPPQADNITPLFPNNVVIEFDDASADTIKKFQAVHLGTVTVTITPTDTTYDPVTVAVTIQNPTQLGKTYNTFDAQIINLANIRGIPPQYIKGQIERESNFNPNTYRYEPLGSDYRTFGPNGKSWRLQSPYANYRLAINDGLADLNSKPWPAPLASPPTQLPQGANLIDADIAPRSTTHPPYLMCLQGLIVQGAGLDTCIGGITNTQPLPSTDTPPQYVSVRELIDLNPSQNWKKYAPKLWPKLNANPILMEFTAQTDLAASYGLLHVLYSTAIGAGWQGQGGAQNPSYLFDTLGRIQAGTSSLPLGTGYAAGYCFIKANGSGLSVAPGFDAPDDFANTFEDTFNVYNNGTVADVDQYGSQIVETFAPTFLPVPGAPIFITN